MAAKSNTTTLTAARLRELLHYDPETGVFTWLVNVGARARRGRVAGRRCQVRHGPYWIVGIDGSRYSAHRLATLYMTGSWPAHILDHKDGDGLNNRWGNLRPATFQQNSANSRRPKTNTSGFKGVTRHKRTGKWQSQIQVNKKQLFLGLFDRPEEAHRAYCAAAEEHFGDFARTE